MHPIYFSKQMPKSNREKVMREEIKGKGERERAHVPRRYVAPSMSLVPHKKKELDA